MKKFEITENNRNALVSFLQVSTRPFVEVKQYLLMLQELPIILEPVKPENIPEVKPEG